MQLHWGKEYLFSVIADHIRSRLREALVDPHYDADEPFPHINGETGEVIAEAHMPGIVRVSRRKLRRLLGWETGMNMMVLISLFGCDFWLLLLTSKRLEV